MSENVSIIQTLFIVFFGDGVFFPAVMMGDVPVAANVCLSLIGFSGGGIVMASQYGLRCHKLSQWRSG